MSTTEQEAARHAKRVAKELGEGWESLTFENLGWHWRAILRYGSGSSIWIEGKPGSYRAHLSAKYDYPLIDMSSDPKRNARAAVSSLAMKIRRERNGLDEALDRIVR